MGLIDLLRGALGDRHVVPPAPPVSTFRPYVPADEPDESVPPAEFAPRLESIEGVACAIVYVDGGGRASERTITCKRLDRKGDVSYLYAWCHVRERVRQFRVDRIREVIDVETGEYLSPGKFFKRFGGSEGAAPSTLWGLSVAHRADLLAGLNALAFVARCDQDFHARELAAIADYAAEWADAMGYRGKLPLADVKEHARRLAPDSELFVVSIARVAERGDPNRDLIAFHLGAVIMADRRLHPNEEHWTAIALRILEDSE